jgi:uncharacterized protein (DUF1330 family)
MPVYIVALIEIEDREEYGRYEAGFLDIFSKYQGEILAVDEAPTAIEGQWPATRSVILRFPSEEEAQRWYNSAEYQALAQHRFRASKGNIALIHGLG